MEVSNQLKLLFHGVDFPVVNFNSERGYYIQSEDNVIEIDITPKVFYPKENPNIFKITQEVKVTADKFFNLFILAVGNFELQGEVEGDMKKAFVNINAPAIMFPYVRSFISTLTTNLGDVTGTLIIPTQFFSGQLEEITTNPQS